MTPNHPEILSYLQTLVKLHPGIPLQAVAWEIRGEYDGWYEAYRGIQAAVRFGTYPGLQLRPHDSGIATLWPAAEKHSDNPRYANPPGRPKVPVNLKRARIIRERLKAARKPHGWAKVAEAMGDCSYTSLRRALLEETET